MSKTTHEIGGKEYKIYHFDNLTPIMKALRNDGNLDSIKLPEGVNTVLFKNIKDLINQVEFEANIKSGNKFNEDEIKSLRFKTDLVRDLMLTGYSQLAYHEDKLIGTAFLSYFNTFNRILPRWEGKGMYIDHKHQGNGPFKIFTKNILRKAKTNGIQKVYTMTLNFQNTEKLYGMIGFEFTGESWKFKLPSLDEYVGSNDPNYDKFDSQEIIMKTMLLDFNSNAYQNRKLKILK